MSKPREFILAQNGDYPCEAWPKNNSPEGGFCGELVHVIEFSSYQAALTELREAREMLAVLYGNIDDQLARIDNFLKDEE